MSRKILLGTLGIIVALSSLPLFAAFEAHVINVTAKIENALTVDATPIEYGTVFPQEQLDRYVTVSLSQSFQDEQRVDDVDYAIRQKPKCWSEREQKYGRVTEADGRFICAGGGDYQVLPILCPYLSKHETTGDGSVDNDSAGINAFHGDPFFWTPTTTIATQVTGRLGKSVQDTADNWKIDLRVPCFAGHCAQDWDKFVLENNPDVNPSDYVQPTENEHKIFGCDIWIEVASPILPAALPILQAAQLYQLVYPGADFAAIYSTCPAQANAVIGIIYGRKSDTTINNGNLEGLLGVNATRNCSTDPWKPGIGFWQIIQFPPSTEFNYQIVFFKLGTYWWPLSADQFPELGFSAGKIYTSEDINNEIYRGPTGSFTTLSSADATPPTFSIQLSEIKSDSVKIDYTSNGALVGGNYIYYSTQPVGTNNQEQNVDVGDSIYLDGSGLHYFKTLTGLAAGTTYHYRVWGSKQYGGLGATVTGWSPDATFTTPSQ